MFAFSLESCYMSESTAKLRKLFPVFGSAFKFLTWYCVVAGEVREFAHEAPKMMKMAVLLCTFVRRPSETSKPFQIRIHLYESQMPQKTKIDMYNFGGKLFYLQLELFCLQLSFFAYSPFPTVSKKAPIVAKEAKAVSKKAPTVSKKAKIVNCK